MSLTDAMLELQELAYEYKLEQARHESKNRLLTWKPFPGKPQEAAYNSPADIVFYGGAAGGGKSDLLLGLAFTAAHKRSIIYRREYTQLKSLIDRGDQMLEPLGIRFVSGDVRTWRGFPDKRIVELGAVNLERKLQTRQGQGKGFIGFDEIPHFPERFFRHLMGWNRTDDPTEHPRVVCAGNPPLSLEEEWVIDFWAAWLDDEHPNPALPGELRWYVTLDDGTDLETPDGNPVMIDGESVQPRSRTFIPAFVEDNPVYMASGYKSVLQGLPPDLKPALLRGKFARFKGSHPYQVIPTQWVIDAQERGKHTPKPDLKMRSMGVDVARGGADQTVLSRLYGNWLAPLLTFPGKDTPDGDEVARKVLEYYENCEAVGIDVIGVGASPYDILKAAIKIMAINASAASTATDQTGKFGFFNLRSQMWWQFREWLDPQNGHLPCLPDDRELRVDLCAPQYKLVGANYKVESKDDIKLRIGRSTDKGDGAVMAYFMANQPEPETKAVMRRYT